jgi:hypothetical protein
MAAKPPPLSSGRAPAEFAKPIPASAIDGSWRSCTLNHEDPAVMRYGAELLKQRSNLLTMHSAVEGRRAAADFVRSTPQLVPPAPTARTGATGAADVPPTPNNFAVYARALAKVDQLKERLGLEYGEGYNLTAGKNTHGERAFADAPVTQASAARARRLEVQVQEAQRDLDALMAGVQDPSASVPAAESRTAAGMEATASDAAGTSQGQQSGGESEASASPEVATVSVEQELAECQAEMDAGNDPFFADDVSLLPLSNDAGGPVADEEPPVAALAPNGDGDMDDDDEEASAPRDMCCMQ